MQSYCLFAPAKINLHLEIIGDRPDGYHELVMIMQSVSLGDIIRIRANGREEIRLFCNHPQVPLDDTNLAYKAARKMQQEYPNASSREGDRYYHRKEYTRCCRFSGRLNRCRGGVGGG